jgi:large subunit ribosomal protein L21
MEKFDKISHYWKRQQGTRYSLPKKKFRGFKMYAVVEYKGNQYKAEKDAVLQVSKISDAKKGDTVTIDTVLLVSDGDKVSVGTPYVKGAKVTVEVGDTFKDKKVLVYKYKSKKDYHRLIGHREEYTNVTVKDVVLA